MSPTTGIQEDLLTELQALDDQRSRYQLDHPAAQLGIEDPDVRRMIEALAYSAVRTRQATMRNLYSTWKRLLSSYFHFILQPLPAMTMTQALVTPQMTDTVTLPRGTMLQLTTQDGAIGSFQTLSELRVVPINLARTELQMSKQGYRLILSFLSLYARADDLGVIPIHLNYLDNYLAALRLHHTLQKHLRSCCVFYDGNFSPDTPGIPCEVTFGVYYDKPYEDNPVNPLEEVRSFFHFPTQDLMIHVKVPPATQTWSKFYLCFDLDMDYPRELPLYREVFRPFSVAVANRRRAFARPIECDGTQDAYPIRFLMNDPSYAMERTLGVYRAAPRGLEPIGQAALGTFRQSYEIEERSELARVPGYSLIIRRPEAFAEPQQLLVEALWYQPYFATNTSGPIRVSLVDRVAVGLDWRHLGTLSSALECPLRQEPDRLLYLLSLKMKPTLNKEELLDLLAMFGSIDMGPYAKISQRVGRMSLSTVPDGELLGAGVRHVYRIELTPHDKEEVPLLTRFVEQLGKVLDAWDYEARVEVRTESPPNVGSGGPTYTARRSRP
jgi:type VI secretion system protein ImpG